MKMPRCAVTALAFLLALCFYTCASAQKTIKVPADQPTVQAGINAATNGDTVLVAPGTYYEHITFKGKGITVTSSDGPAKTTIDGGGTAGVAVVAFKNSETSASVLSNLTIRGGGDDLFISESYGGVYVAGGSPVIQGNVITANSCNNIGVYFANATITGNVISGALQSTQGGSYCSFGSGINLQGTSYAPGRGTLVMGNTIENNSGGGVNLWAAQNVTLINNIIRNNSANGTGGALLTANSAGTAVIQNLIYGNSSCGGAIGFMNGGVVQGPDILIANNTIVNNTGERPYGGSNCTKISQIYPSSYAYGSSGPSAVIVNNILSGSTTYPAVNCGWFENPSEAGQPVFDHNILFNAGGAFFGSYCIDTSGKYSNIVADPQFVNPGTFDFHLRPTSPAIDAGNSSTLQIAATLTGAALAKDFDGNARTQDATGKGYQAIDIGAYEFSGATNTAPTAMVVTSSAYTGGAGSNYALTASLTSALGIPTGSVTSFLDGNQIGASVISGKGVATLSNFLIRPGVHNVIATYPGQGIFSPSVSVVIILNISLYPTKITFTSSPNPSILNQAVQFTVNVSSGDPGFVPTPIKVMDTTGTGAVLATLTPDASGNASFSASSLGLGYHYITASYAGDAMHSSTDAYVYQQVISGYSTTASLTSSANPSNINQSVTFTAHIANSSNGIPTGSVQFSDGATLLAIQPVDKAGNASYTTSTLAAGRHTIMANYVATGAFSNTSAGLTQQVNGLPTTSVLSFSPNPSVAGQSVTLTANVTSTSPGALSGTVAFYADGAQLGSAPLSAGSASITTTALRSGARSLTCAYLGDVNFAGSNCAPVSATVNSIPTATTLVSSTNPAAALSSVTFTANLTAQGKPFPSTVLFYIDGVFARSVSTDTSGNASYTGSFSAGTHTVNAQFPGTDGYNPSSASISQVEVPNPTTSILVPLAGAVYQNQPINIGAAITATTGTSSPNGTVTLSEGATVLAQLITPASAGGTTVTSIRFAMPGLSVGTHLFGVTYAPADSNFLASSSAVLSVTVLPQTFALSLSTPSLSVPVEHHSAFSASVQSLGSFSGTVRLTCAVPQNVYLTCDMSAAQLQLAADGTATSQLTVDTDAVLRFKASEVPRPRNTPVGWQSITLASLLPLPLMLLVRRRKLRALPVLLVLFAVMLSASGCGSKYPAHTPPGVYDVTITATGISVGATTAVTQTVHMQLTVTP